MKCTKTWQDAVFPALEVGLWMEQPAARNQDPENPAAICANPPPPLSSISVSSQLSKRFSRSGVYDSHRTFRLFCQLKTSKRQLRRLEEAAYRRRTREPRQDAVSGDLGQNNDLGRPRKLFNHGTILFYEPCWLSIRPLFRAFLSF
jgi:hypothetical protein